MMNDFLKEALNEAVKGSSAGDGGPFGAVIVKDGEIVGRGHNEVVLLNDPTAHAEMQAIRMASSKLGTFHLKGCTLYTSAEPCPMCFAAIHWAHIDRVIYCNSKAEAAEIGFDDMEITLIMRGEKDSPIPFVREAHEECLDSFRRWYEDENRVEY
jgi:guanine deaminase